MADIQIPKATDAVNKLPSLAIQNLDPTRITNLKIRSKTMEKVNV